MAIPCCVLYNMASGILRSLGDSRTPVVFLILASLLNIVLDLVFVLKFKMGVQGVALATIISQGVSAVLVFIVLMRTSSCVKLEVKL